MGRRWQAVVWGAAIAWLAGCKTGESEVRTKEWSDSWAKARVEYHDARFGLVELIEGKLAIVAVSGLGRDEFDCQWLVGRLLVDELDLKMPALTTISLEAVRELVGSEQHRTLVAAVGEKLAPEANDFLPLAAVATHARFGLWIHLNGADVQSGESLEEETSTTSTYNSTTKEYEESTTTVGYSSNRHVSRHVSAVIFIHDLVKNVPVLIAECRSNGFSERSAFHPNHYPPFPHAPGGSGVVEPLVAMGTKALMKVPVAKVAKIN